MQRPYQFGIALYHLAKLQMLDFSYDFYVKCLNRQKFELCYMDIDSFYLAMSGGSLDEIVKLGLRQAYELTRKMDTQTNLAKHLAYLSLNLLVQEVCGLQLSAILFKIKIRSGRLGKINIAVKVFQRSEIICILSAAEHGCYVIKDAKTALHRHVQNDSVWFYNS